MPSIGGGGSGGGGSPPVQPQFNAQTSGPHPFVLPHVQNLLQRGSDLSNQPLTPFQSGLPDNSRVVPLTPTHNAALDWGRQAIFGPSGMDHLNALHSFATGGMSGGTPYAHLALQASAGGQWNQPAYVHPFLGPPTQPWFTPPQWGQVPGGDGAGAPPPMAPPPAAPSPPAFMPPSQVPGAAPALPSPVDDPTADIPAVPPRARRKDAAPAPTPADGGRRGPSRRTGRWARDATQGTLNPFDQHVIDSGAEQAATIPRARWLQFIGAPYGLPQGSNITPNQQQYNGYDPDYAPSWSEYYRMIDGPGASSAGRRN